MKQVAKYALVGAVVSTFGLFGATETEAQVCVGFPTTGGQMSAAFVADFPTGGNTVGGEVNWNLAGPLAAYAGLYHFNPDIDGADGTTSLGGGVAFDFPALTQALPAGISACPTASVIIADVQDTGVLSIPVGVGFGTTLALGEGGLSLSPYVIPQVRFVTGLDDADTRFLISGGALVNITPSIYAGAQVNRIFAEGFDSVFGLKVGVVF